MLLTSSNFIVQKLYITQLRLFFQKSKRGCEFYVYKNRIQSQQRSRTCTKINGNFI
jgi:hypothetical protein